jgi:hypothetical protein
MYTLKYSLSFGLFFWALAKEEEKQASASSACLEFGKSHN